MMLQSFFCGRLICSFSTFCWVIILYLHCSTNQEIVGNRLLISRKKIHQWNWDVMYTASNPFCIAPSSGKWVWIGLMMSFYETRPSKLCGLWKGRQGDRGDGLKGVAGVMGFQQMYASLGLNHHILEKMYDVTTHACDGRTNRGRKWKKAAYCILNLCNFGITV